MEAGGPYWSYFNFNKRKLYLLSEIVKYWMLNREFAKLIELVHVFSCIIWLCQLGRSRLLLWIIWFFCIFTSTNNENSLFPIWHIKSHQYFKNLFIPSPILQEPLFINLTFFRRILLALKTNSLLSPNHKHASGRWIKTPVSLETGIVLDHLGVLSRVLFALLVFQTCPSLFHPGPEPRVSPVRGDRGWARSCSHQQQWCVLPAYSG